jgi:hypothetical protein
MSNYVALEIKKIFDDNELDDLKRFMKKRKCLNLCNMYLIYLFHFVQSVGILTTTIAAGYDMKFLVWCGIGLNILASLINIYEKTNNNILKKLMNEIKTIKDGNYIGEEQLIDTPSSTQDDNENKSNFNITKITSNQNNKILIDSIQKIAD